MKNLTTKITVLLILTATLAHSGLTGFLTQESRDWDFIQSVGGMKVSAKDQTLVIDCDVSGTREVTVKPTMIHSAMAVRKVWHKRVGNTIQLKVVTSVIEKGINPACKPLNLSAYPDGTYKIRYLNSDGTTQALGEVTLKGANPDK
ncbi:hypothetical protein V2O64_20690 [Verrucomicrobiaceae bacterium 227]